MGLQYTFIPHVLPTSCLTISACCVAREDAIVDERRLRPLSAEGVGFFSFSAAFICLANAVLSAAICFTSAELPLGLAFSSVFCRFSEPPALLFRLPALGR